MQSVLCPKCRQPAKSSSDLVAEDGTVLPVFECESERCQVAFELADDRFSVPFKFAVTADGDLIELQQ